MRRVVLLVFAVVSFASFAACAAKGNAPTVEIVAVTADKARHILHVEIANDDESRARGLMFRTEMPEDHGMLFVFPVERPLGFWMRNTFIPLDMIFIRGDGTIVHIHENAVPEDETVIMSEGPVSRVLELNGGAARRMGLMEGDRLYNEAYFANKLAE